MKKMTILETIIKEIEDHTTQVKPSTDWRIVNAAHYINQIKIELEDKAIKSIEHIT